MEVEAFCEECGEDTVQEVAEEGDAYSWSLVCTVCGTENEVEQ